MNSLLAGASYAVTSSEADLAPYFPSYNGVARDIIGSATYIITAIATAGIRLLLLVPGGYHRFFVFHIVDTCRETSDDLLKHTKFLRT